jgi:hypothetical protein
MCLGELETLRFLPVLSKMTSSFGFSERARLQIVVNILLISFEFESLVFGI